MQKRELKSLLDYCNEARGFLEKFSTPVVLKKLNNIYVNLQMDDMAEIPSAQLYEIVLLVLNNKTNNFKLKHRLLCFIDAIFATHMQIIIFKLHEKNMLTMENFQWILDNEFPILAQGMLLIFLEAEILKEKGFIAIANFIQELFDVAFDRGFDNQVKSSLTILFSELKKNKLLNSINLDTIRKQLINSIAKDKQADNAVGQSFIEIVAHAMHVIHKGLLAQDTLDIAFQHAANTADLLGFLSLRRNGLLDDENHAFLCRHPHFGLDIAQLFISLNKIGYLDSTMRQAVSAVVKHALYISRVIELLLERSIKIDKNTLDKLFANTNNTWYIHSFISVLDSQRFTKLGLDFILDFIKTNTDDITNDFLKTLTKASQSGLLSDDFFTVICKYPAYASGILDVYEQFKRLKIDNADNKEIILQKAHLAAGLAGLLAKIQKVQALSMPHSINMILQLPAKLTAEQLERLNQIVSALQSKGLSQADFNLLCANADDITYAIKTYKNITKDDLKLLCEHAELLTALNKVGVKLPTNFNVKNLLQGDFTVLKEGLSDAQKVELVNRLAQHEKPLCCYLLGQIYSGQLWGPDFCYDPAEAISWFENYLRQSTPQDKFYHEVIALIYNLNMDMNLEVEDKEGLNILFNRLKIMDAIRTSKDAQGHGYLTTTAHFQIKWPAFFQLDKEITDDAKLLKQLHEQYLFDNRNDGSNPQARRDFDNRFGLTVYKR